MIGVGHGTRTYLNGSCREAPSKGVDEDGDAALRDPARARAVYADLNNAGPRHSSAFVKYDQTDGWVSSILKLRQHCTHIMHSAWISTFATGDHASGPYPSKNGGGHGVELKKWPCRACHCLRPRCRMEKVQVGSHDKEGSQEKRRSPEGKSQRPVARPVVSVAGGSTPP